MGSNKEAARALSLFFVFGVIIIAGLGAWWFYSKLGWNSVHLPAIGDFIIGWWYIPLFMFVILFTAFINETDALLDG